MNRKPAEIIQDIKNVEAGNPDEAARMWTKAIRARPEIPRLRVHYADLLARSGELKKALEQISEAVDLKPEQASWIAKRAQYQLRLGLFSEAQESYHAALHLEHKPAWAVARDELRRIIANGVRSPEASAKYYDAFYAVSEKYHAAETAYDPMWERIVSLIPQGAIVLDVGCGPGQFAAFLLARQKNRYIGIDFSREAIELGKQRGLDATFLHLDVMTDSLPECDVIVCTEVLEHIEADLDLLSRFPKGKLVLCSVPSFWSFGHLRMFQGESEVGARYTLEGMEVEGFTLPSGQHIFLFHGRL